MRSFRKLVVVPGLATGLTVTLVFAALALVGPSASLAEKRAGGQNVAVSSSAGQNAVDLGYKVYIGGFHFGMINIDFDLAPKNYDITVKIKTSGMIGRMFPWWMQAYSRGQVIGSSVMPVIAGQRNSWKGRERFIDMKFIDGVARVERIVPNPGADDRDKVPEAMRVGVVDLASAIVSIIRKVDSNDTCVTQIPVFDGRRRYDLLAKHGGVQKLKPNAYTPYVGDTVNCELWIRKKAGFKKSAEPGWINGDRRARVLMGKAFTDVPPVPVRLTLSTPLGTLVAHLNAASHTSGGKKAKLGQSSGSASR